MTVNLCDNQLPVTKSSQDSRLPGVQQQAPCLFYWHYIQSIAYRILGTANVDVAHEMGCECVCRNCDLAHWPEQEGSLQDIQIGWQGLKDITS